MSISKWVAGTAACLVAASAAMATAAETMAYHNPRFDILGLVPAGFVGDPPPANDDGRVFRSTVDSAAVSIWGSYNLEENLAAYREAYRGYLGDAGSRITYEAGGANWFVYSGYDGPRIFYLRVEEGRNCAGETVLAHWQITYLPQDRAGHDRSIGELAGGLRAGTC